MRIVDECEILSTLIDIKKLFKEKPELFDFSKLSLYQIINLLQFDWSTYSTLIDFKALDGSAKALAILNLNKNSNAYKGITLSEEELDKLSSKNYLSLIDKDFRRFIRKENYDKLSRGVKVSIFIDHPEWVIENVDKMPPHLSMKELADMAYKNPKFIKLYITDLSNHSTNYDFWSSMIKYNKEYKDIFLKNTKTVINKSDVRSIIDRYPDIIKMIDKDTLLNFKLTGKELILLCEDIIIRRSPKIFKDWKFPDEVVEAIREDLVVELLSGKSKMTRQMKQAIENTIAIEL